ncbi:MAG: hypothetical protein GY797_11305 [Deltaproteobacteria bacterium]|nr:hypothetical protein [Deltaproteobacteria bacterium]
MEGIDFGQYYPFYNPLGVRMAREKLKFHSSDQIVGIIVTATDMMEDAGYTQDMEYVFRQTGDILLEFNYFARGGEVSDCIAIGSKSAGLISGFK